VFDPRGLSTRRRNHANTDVITVAPDTPLEVALRLLLEEQIGHLPVVDDGVLVGMCTRTEILRGRHRRLTDEDRQPGWRQPLKLLWHAVDWSGRATMTPTIRLPRRAGVSRSSQYGRMSPLPSAARTRGSSDDRPGWSAPAFINS
jgi:hypothetical protein